LNLTPRKFLVMFASIDMPGYSTTYMLLPGSQLTTEPVTLSDPLDWMEAPWFHCHSDWVHEVSVCAQFHQEDKSTYYYALKQNMSGQIVDHCQSTRVLPTDSTFSYSQRKPAMTGFEHRLIKLRARRTTTELFPCEIEGPVLDKITYRRGLLIQSSYQARREHRTRSSHRRSVF